MADIILTDIEGTTSSLSFVKDVLFPYAREHIGSYVRAHRDDPEVTKLLDDVRTEAGDPAMDLDGVIRQLENWIDTDRKVTPLKTLQGMLWEAGYRDKEFYGHVYADAVEAMQQWHAEGKKICIYSSGSVQAQKLLFANTEYGDLTSLFSAYFDTRVGQKREQSSYAKISNELGVPAASILFLSDIEAELDAAKQAGMRTGWLVREGSPEASAPHTCYTAFSEIDPDQV